MNKTEAKKQLQISNAIVSLNSLKAGLSYASLHRPEDVAWYQAQIAQAQIKLSELEKPVA